MAKGLDFDEMDEDIVEMVNGLWKRSTRTNTRHLPY